MRVRRGTNGRGVMGAAAIAVTMFAFAACSDDSGGDAAETPEPETTEPETTEPETTEPETTEPETTEPETTEPEPPSTEFDITLIELDSPGSVASDEEFAWVAGRDGVLSTIDLATNEVVSTTEIPEDAGIAVAGFGSVWIRHDDGKVTRVDKATETIVATIDLGERPGWIDASADSIWVSLTAGGVVRIDPETNEIVAQIDDVGDNSLVLLSGADGIWVAEFARGVHRIDPATNEVVATIELEGQVGLGVGPDAAWPVAAGALNRIDPATNEISDTIEFTGPNGEPAVAAGPLVGGGYVWVRINYESPTGDPIPAVVRVDTETREIVAMADLPPDVAGSFTIGPRAVWFAYAGGVARIDL